MTFAATFTAQKKPKIRNEFPGKRVQVAAIDFPSLWNLKVFLNLNARHCCLNLDDISYLGKFIIFVLKRPYLSSS